MLNLADYIGKDVRPYTFKMDPKGEVYLTINILVINDMINQKAISNVSSKSKSKKRNNSND